MKKHSVSAKLNFLLICFYWIPFVRLNNHKKKLNTPKLVAQYVILLNLSKKKTNNTYKWQTQVFFSALNTVEVVVAECIVSMRFCSSRFQSFHYFSLNFCSTHVHFPTFNSLLFLSCILFRNTPQSLQKYNFKNWVQIGENLWKKKTKKNPNNWIRMLSIIS